jgi:hypothetical protein
VTQPWFAPLPQSASPVGHTHMPPEQTSLERHLLPHPPQLLRSVCWSTHTSGVPHMMPAPAGVMFAHRTHAQFRQLWVGWQPSLHPPQLARSVVKSAQDATPASLSHCV